MMPVLSLLYGQGEGIGITYDTIAISDLQVLNIGLPLQAIKVNKKIKYIEYG